MTTKIYENIYEGDLVLNSNCMLEDFINILLCNGYTLTLTKNDKNTDIHYRKIINNNS